MPRLDPRPLLSPFGDEMPRIDRGAIFLETPFSGENQKEEEVADELQSPGPRILRSRTLSSQAIRNLMLNPHRVRNPNREYVNIFQSEEVF